MKINILITIFILGGILLFYYGMLTAKKVTFYKVPTTYHYNKYKKRVEKRFPIHDKRRIGYKKFKYQKYFL